MTKALARRACLSGSSRHVRGRRAISQRRAASRVAATHWDVFDPTGCWPCTVTMPANFMPLEIGGDDGAGLARDDDDVEYVRRYRLVKP